METMVLGRPGAERSRFEQVITDAGHQVSDCHDGDWGCVGMDGTCPLDAHAIDVAVAIPEPGGRFDAQGIACAHRARIPIVAVGATPADPVLRYATTNVSDEDELLAAMDAAVGDASGCVRAVEEVLAEHLGPDEQVGVSARRDGLHLQVRLAADVHPERASTLADLARGAARAHDRRASVIDVSVVSPVPPA